MPFKNYDLATPAMRILAVLNKSKTPLTDSELAISANVPRSWVVGYVFKAGLVYRHVALVELGFAEAVVTNDGRKKKRTYIITNKGRQYYEAMKTILRVRKKLNPQRRST